MKLEFSQCVRFAEFEEGAPEYILLGFTAYRYGKDANRLWYTGKGIHISLCLFNRYFTLCVIQIPQDLSKRPVRKSRNK